nr:hypothetical protein Ade03nite_41540 [Actinoplanes derwentensis]
MAGAIQAPSGKSNPATPSAAAPESSPRVRAPADRGLLLTFTCYANAFSSRTESHLHRVAGCTSQPEVPVIEAAREYRRD